MAKTVVCLVCGGQSAEHEVSLQSAKNVLDAMDRSKYDIVLVGIDKSGVWRVYSDYQFTVNSDDPAKIALSKSGDIAFPMLSGSGPVLVEVASGRRFDERDVSRFFTGLMARMGRFRVCARC